MSSCSVEGNPNLCLSDSCRKPPKKKVLLVPIVALVASAAIVIAVLVLFLVLKKKKSRIVQGTYNRVIIQKKLYNFMNMVTFFFSRTGTPMVNDKFANKKSRRFTYSEVIKMTNNLERVLGKGGFGVVYHGTVNGYEEVAVKVLSQSSTQGYKQFKAEVFIVL